MTSLKCLGALLMPSAWRSCLMSFSVVRHDATTTSRAARPDGNRPHSRPPGHQAASSTSPWHESPSIIGGQPELQVLGCGHQTVTVQLRGKIVLLHHNGSTANMKRVAFEEMLLPRFP